MADLSSSDLDLRFAIDNTSEEIVGVLYRLGRLNWTLTVASDPFLSICRELQFVYGRMRRKVKNAAEPIDAGNHRAQLRQISQQLGDLETLASPFLTPNVDKTVRRVPRELQLIIEYPDVRDDPDPYEYQNILREAARHVSLILEIAEENSRLRIRTIRPGSVIITIITSSAATMTALTALMTGRSLIRKNDAEATKAGAEAARTSTEIIRVQAEAAKLYAEATQVQVATTNAAIDNLERLLSLVRRQQEAEGSDFTIKPEVISEFLLIQFPHLERLPNALEHLASSLYQEAQVLQHVMEAVEPARPTSGVSRD